MNWKPQIYLRRAAKSPRALILFWLVFYGPLFIGLVLLLKNPIFLQKVATVKTVDSLYDVAKLAPPGGSINSHNAKIKDMIAKIPYQRPSETTFSVLPEDKYQWTIVEGRGNCSNLVFGAAWFLDSINIPDIHLIHFLPTEQYLFGYGHTVLLGDGIFDIFDGGVWEKNNGDGIALADLINREVGSRFNFTPLSSRLSGNSDYIQPDFLDASAVAIIPNKEIIEYFRFIETIYVPLGNEWLEKLTFDSIALLTGYLPNAYTTKSIGELSGRYSTYVWLANAWLWGIRIAILHLISLALFKLTQRGLNTFRKPA